MQRPWNDKSDPWKTKQVESMKNHAMVSFHIIVLWRKVLNLDDWETFRIPLCRGHARDASLPSIHYPVAEPWQAEPLQAAWPVVELATLTVSSVIKASGEHTQRLHWFWHIDLRTAICANFFLEFVCRFLHSVLGINLTPWKDSIPHKGRQGQAISESAWVSITTPRGSKACFVCTGIQPWNLRKIRSATN